MRRNCVRAAGIVLIAYAAISVADDSETPWVYKGEFHKAIVAADRITVRCGGFNCCQSVDGQKVLFEVRDAQQIKAVYDHIHFKSLQDKCFCCGYPGIDWYQGGKRVALTSLQHGHALNWKGFPDQNVELTAESAKWLADWFAKHDVLEPKHELEAPETKRVARAILQRFMPPGYLEALTRAKKEIEDGALGVKVSDDLIDNRILALFRDKKAMYTALFRIMGCLPTRWDARYSDGQQEAEEFLTHAPCKELGQAVQAAAQSKDPVEKHGAARVVFSQMSMTEYGKTDADLAKWMAMLVCEAYTDPFPGNRRVVLSQLINHVDVAAWDILEQAIGDPDATVRRKAVEALTLRKGPKAIAILNRVAFGKVHVRKAVPIDADYSYGTALYGCTCEMDEGENLDTDQEAARKAIETLK